MNVIFRKQIIKKTKIIILNNFPLENKLNIGLTSELKSQEKLFLSACRWGKSCMRIHFLLSRLVTSFITRHSAPAPRQRRPSWLSAPHTGPHLSPFHARLTSDSASERGENVSLSREHGGAGIPVQDLLGLLFADVHPQIGQRLLYLHGVYFTCEETRASPASPPIRQRRLTGAGPYRRCSCPGSWRSAAASSRAPSGTGRTRWSRDPCRCLCLRRRWFSERGKHRRPRFLMSARGRAERKLWSRTSGEKIMRNSLKNNLEWRQFIF